MAHQLFERGIVRIGKLIDPFVHSDMSESFVFIPWQNRIIFYPKKEG